ncbi:MAG: hypothetical protein U5L02_12485 [Rheinheimera sp.]|nr:hypothetical protein [Rheinheimera sp.]
MKVLFTGFEPFGGESTNPSAVAVEQICLAAAAGWCAVAGFDFAGRIQPQRRTA